MRDWNLPSVNLRNNLSCGKSAAVLYRKLREVRGYLFQRFGHWSAARRIPPVAGGTMQCKELGAVSRRCCAECDYTQAHIYKPSGQKAVPPLVAVSQLYLIWSNASLPYQLEYISERWRGRCGYR